MDISYLLTVADDAIIEDKLPAAGFVEQTGRWTTVPKAARGNCAIFQTPRYIQFHLRSNTQFRTIDAIFRLLRRLCRSRRIPLSINLGVSASRSRVLYISVNFSSNTACLPVVSCQACLRSTCPCTLAHGEPRRKFRLSSNEFGD